MYEVRAQATPKTLDEAIQNGIDSAFDSRVKIDPSLDGEGRVKVMVEQHVKDFIAQKFSALILRTEDASDEVKKEIRYCWFQITGQVIK